MRVLVREYRGASLDREANEIKKGLIYVRRIHIITYKKRPFSGVVGFPEEDVFYFDEGLYGELVAAWDGDETTFRNLWSEAWRIAPSVLV